ncbi:MAG: hypothetical protein GXO55_07100, partial [Chloroflexi bacterium]|nr:hypothetical protein [Chloroflexota bacterium]
AGLVKAIVTLLRVRFGIDEAEAEAFRARLEEVEAVEDLEDLHIAALQADALEAFERILDERG